MSMTHIDEPYVLDETREAEIAAQVAARFGHRWGDPEPVAEVEAPEPQEGEPGSPSTTESLPDGAAQVQAAGDGSGGSSSTTTPAPATTPATTPAPAADPNDPAFGLTPTITSPLDAAAADPNATRVDPSAWTTSPAGGGDAASPPAAASTAAPASDAVDINAYITRAYGDVTPDQVLSVFGFYETVASAPAPIQNAIGALLNGDVDAATRALGVQPAPATATTVPATAPSTTAVTGTPATTPAPIEAYDAWGQPITIPVPTTPATPAVDPVLEQRLAELEAARQADMQRAYQAEIERAQAQANEGLAMFRTAYTALDATDLMLLQRQVNQRGNIDMVNARAQSYGGDYKRAYYEALDTFAWSDPTIRAKLNQAEVAATQAQAVADAARQSKASALAGGGGVPQNAAAVHAPPANPARPNPPAAPGARPTGARNGRPLRDSSVTDALAAEVRKAAGIN